MFHIHQIHVFDRAGSLFAFMTMIIKKLLMFPWLILFTSLIETNFSIAIMQLINPSYLWKDEVKQIKLLKQKLLQRCIFTRSLRIQPLKSSCFSFLPSFVIYLSGIDLLKSPSWSVWTVCTQDLLKGTILRVTVFDQKRYRALCQVDETL